MSHVADDFAAIAKRLKEIQQEVATESAAARTHRQPGAECQPEPCDICLDVAACE